MGSSCNFMRFPFAKSGPIKSMWLAQPGMSPRSRIYIFEPTRFPLLFAPSQGNHSAFKSPPSTGRSSRYRTTKCSGVTPGPAGKEIVAESLVTSFTRNPFRTKPGKIRF